MATILIVDDTHAGLTILSQVLRAHGHECLNASNGDMGYVCAKEYRPDLILMDVVLPDHNGFHTCRRLKRDSATKDIPVVLLGNEESATDETWGRKMGAVDYLRKPLSPVEILAAVSRLV